LGKLEAKIGIDSESFLKIAAWLLFLEQFSVCRHAGSYLNYSDHSGVATGSLRVNPSHLVANVTSYFVTLIQILQKLVIHPIWYVKTAFHLLLIDKLLL